MKRKILLLDDDEILRGSLAKGLSDRGMDVVSSDGEHAASRMAAQVFDAIVVDVLMPVVDGIEVISAVKARYPQTRIIAISGGGAVSAQVCLTLAEAMGADRILRKPVDPEDLAIAVCRPGEPLPELIAV